MMLMAYNVVSQRQHEFELLCAQELMQKNRPRGVGFFYGRQKSSRSLWVAGPVAVAVGKGLVALVPVGGFGLVAEA